MKPEDSQELLASPELRQLLRRARNHQPLPRVRVSADQIYDAWQAKRRVRTRRWQHGVFAVAACLGLITAGASIVRMQARGGDEAAVVLASQVAESAPVESARRPDVAIPREPIALRVDAQIAALEPDAPAPEVVGPAAIVVGDGTYRITLGGEAALRVGTPNGDLELRPGIFTVAVASRRTDVVLETGEAFWVRDGALHPVAAPVRLAEASALPGVTVPSAAELARVAEAELARGRRSQAIRAFRQLVQTYPRAPESSRGLLDLARLQRADGNADAARCAYELYLRRHPKSALAGDVRRALDRLGPGRRCNGLQPG